LAFPTDDNENRIRGIINNLTGTESADDLMLELLDILQEGNKVPEVGKIYAFVYQPKTPNIQYDQNPLVAVTDIFQWGFRGLNYHWGQVRQYTWNEIAGGIYEIYPEELSDAIEIPFGNIRLNN